MARNGARVTLAIILGQTLYQDYAAEKSPQKPQCLNTPEIILACTICPFYVGGREWVVRSDILNSHHPKC